MVAGDRSNQCPQGFSLVPAGPYCAGKVRHDVLLSGENASSNPMVVIQTLPHSELQFKNVESCV